MTQFTNTCRVTVIDHMGDDTRVVDAARVSFAKQSDGELTDKDARLIRYLADNDHWTPSAHVMVTLRIAAPVFVARQWFRSCVGVGHFEPSGAGVVLPV